MWGWLRRMLGLPEWAFDVPSGGARVQDGDSLVVGERRIRLSGIDAPEIGQPVCGPGGEDAGRLAASALREMVRGRALRVRPEGQDVYGRIVASVSAEGVGDLSMAMLAGGWGVALPSAGRSGRRAQAAAERSGLGVWGRGGIVKPWIWRAQMRAAKVVQASLDGRAVRER
jgi:endonuclease YncB( thermonuclease family)